MEHKNTIIEHSEDVFEDNNQMSDNRDIKVRRHSRLKFFMRITSRVLNVFLSVIICAFTFLSVKYNLSFSQRGSIGNYELQEPEIIPDEPDLGDEELPPDDVGDNEQGADNSNKGDNQDESNASGDTSEEPKPVNISKMTGLEAFTFASKMFNESDNITMTQTGTVEACTVVNMTQSIYARKYKVNKDTYFSENISKGQVILGIDTNVAERVYYNASNNVLEFYKGSNIQSTSATYSSLDSTMSLDEWRKSHGTSPLEFYPYTVNSNTIDSVTKPQRCYLPSGDKGYVIKLSLKANSTELYRRQIRASSGLSSDPSFDYINIFAYLNNNCTFARIDVSEKYYVKKGVTVTMFSTTTSDFIYEASKIPVIR